MVHDKQDVGTYFSVAIEEGLYSSKGNLRFHLEHLFEDTDLENKRMLDVGGGTGIHSFYAACMGAREVVCLEPEIEGSTSEVTRHFRRVLARMPCKQVRLESTMLQTFPSENNEFDIILLHNSINHLNETACMNLPSDETSKEIYRDIFSHIYALSAPGAVLIVCDCTRHNFFAHIGLKSPFTPTIEWRKHQPPTVWAALLGDVGFRNPKIRWTPVNRLRTPGKILLGNRWASYFTNSHFCLKMVRV